MRNVVSIGSIVFCRIFNQKNPQLFNLPHNYVGTIPPLVLDKDEHLGELEVSHSFPAYRSFQLCAISSRSVKPLFLGCSSPAMWKSCLLSHALHTARRPSKWLNYSSTRSVQSSSKPYDVAVIGGGVTGLTAAYRLSQDPNCKGVTLYERSSRLGGWLESEKLKVDGGEVVFEHGPRTLRTGLPSALPMMDLVCVATCETVEDVY
jgi:hypothetical protein